MSALSATEREPGVGLPAHSSRCARAYPQSRLSYPQQFETSDLYKVLGLTKPRIGFDVKPLKRA
jgi:hypothetical protein